ncbi:MAG: hypothetical protein QW356_05470 [Candidatus Hadarchaeales archaeon]
MNGQKWYLCPRCGLAFLYPHPIRGLNGKVLFEVCPRCGCRVEDGGKEAHSYTNS